MKLLLNYKANRKLKDKHGLRPIGIARQCAIHVIDQEVLLFSDVTHVDLGRFDLGLPHENPILPITHAHN